MSLEIWKDTNKISQQKKDTSNWVVSRVNSKAMWILEDAPIFQVNQMTNTFQQAIIWSNIGKQKMNTHIYLARRLDRSKSGNYYLIGPINL